MIFSEHSDDENIIIDLAEIVAFFDGFVLAEGLDHNFLREPTYIRLRYNFLKWLLGYINTVSYMGPESSNFEDLACQMLLKTTGLTEEQCLKIARNTEQALFAKLVTFAPLPKGEGVGIDIHDLSGDFIATIVFKHY